MIKTNGNIMGESMQNNTLSLLSLFALSVAFVIQPAFAQENTSQEAKPVVAQTEVNKTNTDSQTADSQTKQTANAQPNKNTEAVDKLIGDNVAINTDRIVDFPGRPTLGSIEMATLPGINETLITGPAPMGKSLSAKDMPSEQLLGRITTEVFQEMADLERGNVFLNLQKQKEELKNSLEELRAKYRQARLEEIAKREDVVRSRINWWQEQENIRIEMERKKAETEAIEQQIVEAEELREKLRNEAIAEKMATPQNVVHSEIEPTAQPEAPVPAQEDTIEPEESVATNTLTQPVQTADELYSLIGVRGLKGRLTARLQNKEDGSVLNVKKGQRLKTGHKVIRIDRDTIQLSYAGRIEVIILNTTKQAALD